jgi:hypothetical protein
MFNGLTHSGYPTYAKWLSKPHPHIVFTMTYNDCLPEPPPFRSLRTPGSLPTSPVDPPNSNPLVIWCDIRPKGLPEGYGAEVRRVESLQAYRQNMLQP